jgi:competence protein ComEA
MLRHVITALAFALASLAAQAADVNQASQAELEAIKGIGPAMAGKILDERKKGAFKDWADLAGRVKGIGEGNAAKFSTAGLTVGGSAFKAAATPAAEKKPAKAKADGAAAQR